MAAKMTNETYYPVFKLFIQDLSLMELKNDTWHFKFDSNREPEVVNQFQIQGTVSKITGFNDEILIVSDGTNKAKVTRGPNVPGDFSWLRVGVYCSILGNLLESGKLPHVGVIKLAEVKSKVLHEMWQYEVPELKLVMSKKVSPCLELI